MLRFQNISPDAEARFVHGASECGRFFMGGVNLVMRDEDLQTFKRRHLGKGYEERVPGSGKLLDSVHGVNLDVLSTGRFPGDDKPKPIAFPDPSTAALRGERFALIPMPRYIELKLASGIAAPHRGKDLVDVQELIRSAALAPSVAEELHPSVREKFLELWRLAQVPRAYGAEDCQS